MDSVFHTVSAMVLAEHLGEKRNSALFWAGFIGIVPDLITFAGINILPRGMSYSIGHSLLTQAAICLMLVLFNRKIAFGGILHIGVDIITHSYTTRHLFYPFRSQRVFNGINWYDWEGIWVPVMLWLILLLAIYRDHRAARRRFTGQTARS